jgi:formamidopyrimidine-DNA glycosylase
MPELPEVETTRRGIEPYVLKQTISGVKVRNRSLRWPVPKDLASILKSKTVVAVKRRAKYLLLQIASGPAKPEGFVIIHLGMSGSLRLVSTCAQVAKHDHVDICFNNNQVLRFTDPRRFGCVLWQAGAADSHKLLAKLGPEPLSEQFDGDCLFKLSRRRKAAVKTFIMDAHIVVGVGNIYANEALFSSGIRPDREAGRISRKRYQVLAQEIKQVLASAIRQGGTTLKDFVGGDGKPGYFKQELAVYGRAGLACVRCQRALAETRIGQRSTVFCKDCQN